MKIYLHFFLFVIPAMIFAQDKLDEQIAKLEKVSWVGRSKIRKEIAKGGEKVIPMLIEKFPKLSKKTQEKLVFAFSEIKIESEFMLNALIKFFWQWQKKDPTGHIFSALSHALVGNGEKAQAEVIKAYKSATIESKKQLLSSLSRIKTKQVQKFLITALSQEPLKEQAISGLRNFTPFSPAAYLQLAKMLSSDKEAKLHWDIIFTLKKIKSEQTYKLFLSEFKRRKKSKDSSTLQAIIEALIEYPKSQQLEVEIVDLYSKHSIDSYTLLTFLEKWPIRNKETFAKVIQIKESFGNSTSNRARRVLGSSKISKVQKKQLLLQFLDNNKIHSRIKKFLVPVVTKNDTDILSHLEKLLWDGKAGYIALAILEKFDKPLVQAYRLTEEMNRFNDKGRQKNIIKKISAVRALQKLLEQADANKKVKLMISDCLKKQSLVMDSGTSAVINEVMKKNNIVISLNDFKKFVVDRNSWVRHGAVEALGKSKTPENIAFLQKVYKSKSKLALKAGINLLKLGQEVKNIKQVLENFLKNSTVAQAKQLEVIPAFYSLLIGHIGSPNRTLRRNTVTILQKLPRKFIASKSKELVELLRPKNSIVRANTLAILIKTKASWVKKEEKLFTELAQDPHSTVRLNVGYIFLQANQQEKFFALLDAEKNARTSQWMLADLSRKKSHFANFLYLVLLAQKSSTPKTLGNLQKAYKYLRYIRFNTAEKKYILKKIQQIPQKNNKVKGMINKIIGKVQK